MNKKERVFIIIDGSNFYHRLREIFSKRGSLLGFDYSRFENYLAGKRKIVLKKYYIGIIRARPEDTKAQTMRRNQQRLLARLRKDHWKIGTGYILDTEEGYHEKGVDVQIAVDLLIGAYEDLYDTAILVSSDTDLIPAIEKVRSMKKKIEYIGFSHKPSYGLIANSDVRRLLIKDELFEYFRETYQA